MRNAYRALLDLMPAPALLVGDVIALDNGVATVQLPTGGTVQARGSATLGARVFVRNGLIEGEAPALTLETIEI